jgi:hypothetical protein
VGPGRGKEEKKDRINRIDRISRGMKRRALYRRGSHLLDFSCPVNPVNPVNPVCLSPVRPWGAAQADARRREAEEKKDRIHRIDRISRGIKRRALYRRGSHLLGFSCPVSPVNPVNPVCLSPVRPRGAARADA